MTELDLSTSRRVHIVGIGGSGMSAIAKVLLGQGHVVSGSDAAESTTVTRLREAGAIVNIGHADSNVTIDIDALAISTAVSPDNPEVQAARRLGVPVLRRAEILASLSGTRRAIAVAGTHGKTTTSTFTALVLEAGGMLPSWIIGGELTGKGDGARWDSGPWFVVEADESDGTFLELNAEAAIVTNVEPDHLEHYGGWANLQLAFKKFVEQTPGPCVVCVDDTHAAELVGGNVIGYGTGADARYRITNVQLGRFDARFTVTVDGERIDVTLPAPGLHNVRNATAALAMGHQLGVPLSVAAVGLANYGGVGRRFQQRGSCNDVTFVDDYAHLPTEVRSAISAAVAGEWTRVVAVFQPHRYSRTEQVGADFGGSFDGADILVLAGVYGAGEPVREGITGHIVRQAVEAEPGHPQLIYVEDRSTLAQSVADVLEPGDLCLTLGAGDVTKLADEIIALLPRQ